jgi:hypothetical protein
MKRGAIGARGRVDPRPPGRLQPLSGGGASAPAPARLAELKELMACWQPLQEFRRTADPNQTSCHDLRRHAATSLAACSRAEMTAALIAQRGSGPGVQIRAEVDAAVVVLVTLLDGGLQTLSESWHLPERDVRMTESSLSTVIGPPAIFGAASLPTPSDPPLLGEGPDFALAPLLF